MSATVVATIELKESYMHDYWERYCQGVPWLRFRRGLVEEFARQLERRLGSPVVDSVAATFWLTVGDE